MKFTGCSPKGISDGNSETDSRLPDLGGTFELGPIVADLVATEAIGIPYDWERAISLVLSAFLTGIGGGLFVLMLGAITPEVFFLNYTFLILAMVVVGGIDVLAGSIIGSKQVGVVGEVLRRAEQGSVPGLIATPAWSGPGRFGVLFARRPIRVADGISGVLKRVERRAARIERTYKEGRSRPV